MKILRSFLVPALALSLTASSTTIPPDLEARAAELRKQASPPVLVWVHDQGVALAKARGPIDVALLERNIRSQFVMKRAPVAKQPSASGPVAVPYPNLGNMADADIMALCFIVMMEAAKSAQEDLKAIMDGVKAINKEKKGWRKAENTVNKMAASVSPTPTPVPDRVIQLVAAARSTESRTRGANLSTLMKRISDTSDGIVRNMK